MVTRFLARHRYTVQRIGFAVITLTAIFTVLPIIGTIIYIFVKGISAISV
jgi:hypothetical protein